MAIRFSQSVEEHWALVYKLGGTQPLETKVAGRTEIYSTRRAWNNLHTASCIDTGSTKLHRTRNVHLDSYIGWTGALIIQSGLPWTVYYSSIYTRNGPLNCSNPNCQTMVVMGISIS